MFFNILHDLDQMYDSAKYEYLIPFDSFWLIIIDTRKLTKKHT